MDKHIPVAKPVTSNEELNLIKRVLDSGILAQGKMVEEFETRFSEYVDVKKSIALSNGTVSLDVALKALGIKEGDEVITTPFTFIATSNSILYQKAKPVFADIDEKTFNINPDEILKKITGKTKAVIGVHLFGHPFDIKSIRKICDDYDLFLIEDCAQAHGAEYEGQKVGSFGTGCFSFYPTKNMTTGEGGVITTNDDEINDKCRLLRNHGQSSKYYHTILGYNYRMTDLQAAIGIAQLNKLNEFNRKRILNAEYYNRHLKKDGLITPHKESNVKHVYHQYVITIKKDSIDRDMFMKYLADNGIGCAVHYPLPIFSQPLYRNLGYSEDIAKFPVTSDLVNRVLSLPVHPSLLEEDLEYIVETVNTFQELK